MRDETVEYPIGDDPPKARLIYGVDVIQGLKLLKEASVDTVCTGPPYWGLRDYGRTGQIGLEQTPEEYVTKIVEVFREVRRVLKPNGTLWVNLGDSYAADRGGTHQPAETLAGGVSGYMEDGSKINRDRYDGYNPSRNAKLAGLKHKDLVGIPWRVAFALQADGWYLRNDIIWAKPNPMPESVQDRCTKSHEYIFLMAHPDSKGRYYYDAEAIREESSESSLKRSSLMRTGTSTKHEMTDAKEQRCVNMDHGPYGAGRNKRTIWDVTLVPYRGSHFAVFPPKLIEPMIKAGCPKGGVVLDVFSGSATTGMVALELQRNYIGIDLNDDYLPLAKARLLGKSAPGPSSNEPNPILDLFEEKEQQMELPYLTLSPIEY